MSQHYSDPKKDAKLLQVSGTFKGWDAAYDCLMAQRTQHGHLASRIFVKDGRFHVQSLHMADGLELGQWLPDGMRLVLPIGLHWLALEDAREGME